MNLFEVDKNEFNLYKPAIFQPFNWLSYGETRRNPGSREPMSGSTAMSDRVIGQAYDRVKPDVPKEAWMVQEREKVAQRIALLQRQLGIRAVAAPRPNYRPGQEYLIDLDTQGASVDSSLPYLERASYDAAVMSLPGQANLLSPADCVLVNVAVPQRGSHEPLAAQIHANSLGLITNVIGNAMERLHQEHDALLADAHIYISPHARGYTLYGDFLDQARQNGYDDFMEKTSSDNERPIFHMGALAVAQLQGAGIKEAHVEVSLDDSFTDPTLYSERNLPNKGFAGRNGFMFGLKSPVDHTRFMRRD